MSLVRLLLVSAAIYLFFLLAFPQWEGQAYHFASLGLIAAGAVGVWLFLKAVDFGEGLFKIGVELAFFACVALYFGCTLPQKSGKSPIAQWTQGRRIPFLTR